MTRTQRTFERLVQILYAQLLAALEVAIHERVVELDDPVRDLLMRSGDRREIGRLLGRGEKTVRDGSALACGQVQRQTFAAEALPDVGYHALEVRRAGVDLVHDDEPAELAFRRRSHHPL